LNKVEPREAVLACNLLSKDFPRAALADEMVPGGPKVPLVSKPRSAACRGERLAGARSCPDGTVCGPASEAERVVPDADPREPVTPGVSRHIGRSNIEN
jgi:hypothetical protein